MAYCTEAQVRNSDRKLIKTEDVIPDVVLDRISQAEKIIKVDLSPIIDGVTLDGIGATSDLLNLLATLKAVELCLVAYYGVSRKVDELTDVQYFKKEYEKFRDKTLDGTLKLVAGAVDYTPKDYPSLDGGSNKKFYVRKGVSGFINEGEAFYGQTYVDDSVKN
jgi:hypothetical protein